MCMRQKSKSVAMEKKRSFDHISNLPDGILHELMFRLPTPDTAKISLLSKKFHSVWNSFPDVVFDCKRSITTTTRLDSFLRRQLQHQPQPQRDLLSVRKFVLRFLYLPLGYCCDALDQTILLAVQRKAVELHLSIQFRDSQFYRLPQISCPGNRIRVLNLKALDLDSNPLLFPNLSFLEYISLKQCKISGQLNISSNILKELVICDCLSITALIVTAPKLQDFTLQNMSGEINIVACNIKSLSLTRVNLTGEWLSTRLMQLLLLETLVLSECATPTTLGLKSKCLKFVEFIGCPQLSRITMNAPSLQRFCYRSSQSLSNSCVLNISSACFSLKSLVLESLAMSDEWFHSLVSQFVFLEDLEINKSNTLKKIAINSKNLKTLQLSECHCLEKLDVDAKQLVKFTYKSTRGLMSSPPRIDSRFLEVHIVWNPYFSYHLLENLTCFLKGLGHCKVLKLDFLSNELLNFPLEMKITALPPLLDLNHIQVNLTIVDNMEVLVDNLLWMCPRIQTITIILHGRRQPTPIKVLQFKYDQNSNAPYLKSKTHLCCDFCRAFKCFRHSVSSVTMVNFSDNEQKAMSRYFTEMSRLINVEQRCEIQA